MSTECDNVPAFVLEISAECSDGSNSREALEAATGLNMNISRDSEVSLECVNHEATERQHDSAETEVVPSDGSAETSDVVAKPASEAANGLHGSVGRNDDLATEQADSVLPPAQEECVTDEVTERPHESAETEVLSYGSAETSDVVAKPAAEAASGLHSSVGSHDDLATEQADYVLPPAQVTDLEQRPAELVEIQVSGAAEPSFETEQPGCSVVLAVRKENGNTLRPSRAEAVAENARDDEIGSVGSYEVSKELLVALSLPADAPDDRPTTAELVEVAVSTAVEPKSGTDQPKGENANAFQRLLAERVREKASKKDRGKTSARSCGARFSAGTRRGKAVSSHRAKGTPPPKRSGRLSFERWKILLAPPRARPLSKTTAGVLSRGRSSRFQEAGAPKVRYKKGKLNGNADGLSRSP
ncbi:uncharacterized protein LOC144170864 [Haemaphysalis longicornis]